MLNKMTFLAKIFDAYKHHAVICISILILGISLRLADLNIYFYDVLLSAKTVQIRVYRNDSKFYYFLFKYVTYKISRLK